VTYDLRVRRPYEFGIDAAADPAADSSYAELTARVFARGPRS
jgi:hypothetical protein